MTLFLETWHSHSHLSADDGNKKNSVGPLFLTCEISHRSLALFIVYIGCLPEISQNQSGWWKKKNMASNTRPCACGSSVRRARGAMTCCPEPADANVQALCDKVCPNVFSHSVEQSWSEHWCHRAVFFFSFWLRTLIRWGIALKSGRIESFRNLMLSSTRPSHAHRKSTLWRWAVQWLLCWCVLIKNW